MADVDLRIVIMGACGASGRALAHALRDAGANLVLADHDAPALSALGRELGCKALFCDVVSQSSIEIFRAEIEREGGPVDVLINAAGSGYERTLAMYRVSRALLPLLRRGRGPRWIVNVPPSKTEAGSTIFSYASSEEAFARLSEAIAQEAYGSGVNVGIACPATDAIKHVGDWLVHKPAEELEPERLAHFGRRVAALLQGSGRTEVQTQAYGR
jgi:NAD(P)-dependent dehydrogenase (short-subunit alcohol dehydrogenase family)